MGKKNGYGVRTWSEGQVYSGEWSNGKMNGNTTWNPGQFDFLWVVLTVFYI